jgi:hypothetical protein
MADKRIYQLSDATVTTGKYIALDKSGNTEAERYLLTSILPDTIYRAYTFTSVSTGESTVPFQDAWPAGTVYDILPIWGWAGADYGYVPIYPTDKGLGSFKFTCDLIVTFVYIAIKLR